MYKRNLKNFTINENVLFLLIKIIYFLDIYHLLKSGDFEKVELY